MQNDNKYDLIKFEDGEFSLDVNVSPKEDTVWLTQKEISLLYQKARTTIADHISSIFRELELQESAVCRTFRHTAKDGKSYNVKYYNLDMILAVGYRVKSKRGIAFRIWATSILKQYMLNGYSINEKRCLECQDNLISLNNKVDYLYNQNQSTLERLTNLENIDTILTDKLFYEGQIFDAYSYIKKLFLLAKSSITIMDSYVDISVLDMLVNISLPIMIYTYPSALLSNQDINRFNINHSLTVIKTNKIHDRFILIDDVIYLCGSSIKDVGRKRFVLTKLESISKEMLLKEIGR